MRENGVSEVVKTEIRGGLAILTIDNPPVNALSTGVRRGLSQALENVSKDSQVRAVVITCADAPSSAAPISANLESRSSPRI